MIQILEEPTGITYKSLVSLAFSICDEFILVKRDQLELGSKGLALLEQLTPHLKEVKRQDEWPGTLLLEHYADVYYFDCNEEAEKTILHTADRLYQWMQPELPDDLSFFKNKESWLINTAHEGLGRIKTTNRDEILKIREIDGIMIY